MHELSLVHALFDETDRAIGAHPPRAVRLITVRVGELAGVEPSLFRTAFGVARQERGYPAAELLVVEEPARWQCPTCAAELPPGERLQCTVCGDDAILTSGGTLLLERLELEVNDV